MNSGSPSRTVHARRLMLVLCGCGITVSLMHTLVAPLLPGISHSLGLSQGAASWLLTSTMLAGAVCAPVCGRLGDMVGKRKMLAVALAVMAAGSLLGALSWSFESLLVARALQGAAFGVLPLGISILKDELPADRVMAGTATMSSTLGVGGAVGMPVAGVIAQLADWHAVFWAATAVSVLSLVLVLLVVPESPIRSGGRFDVVGAVGLAAVLIGLLIALSQGGSWGWGSPAVLGLFGGSAAVFALWALHQWRVRQPMVDLRTSTRPVVLLTNAATVLIGFGMFANFMLAPLILQAPVETGHGFGASVLVTGLCMVPTGLGMLFFSPLSAKLSAAKGAHVTLLAGALVMVAGNLAMTAMPGSLLVLMAVLMFLSVGSALCFSAMPTLIMAWVPVTQTASANSLNSLLRTVGTSTCAAIGGTLLAASAVPVGGVDSPATGGFQAVFWVAAAASVAAAGLAAAVTAVVRRSARLTAEEGDAATMAVLAVPAPAGEPDAAAGTAPTSR